MSLQMELEQGPEVLFFEFAWVKHTVGPDSGAMYFVQGALHSPFDALITSLDIDLEP